MTQVTAQSWTLSPDRLFAKEEGRLEHARHLYSSVKDLPLLCPHGHINPALLADENTSFGNPAELFVIPDHYVFRMLYSRGVRLGDLGVPTTDGTPVERDGRAIWRRFAEHFHLFAGTPTGLWLKDELINVFGVTEKPSKESADRIYDELEAKLAEPEFTPRALFKRFNIGVLCTTDAATDTLGSHQALRAQGWTAVRPTFRPDAVVNLDAKGWRDNIGALSEVSGVEVARLRLVYRSVGTAEGVFQRERRDRHRPRRAHAAYRTLVGW